MILTGTATAQSSASLTIVAVNRGTQVTQYWLWYVGLILTTSASAGTRSATITVTLADQQTTLTEGTGSQTGTATTYSAGAIVIGKTFNSGTTENAGLSNLNWGGVGAATNSQGAAYLAQPLPVYKIVISATLIAGDTYAYGYAIDERRANQDYGYP